MAIARKLVGIGASAVATSPVNLALLATHPSDFPFLSPQFGADFRFEKRFQDRLDGRSGGDFGLLLHRVQHVLALLTL